MEEKFYLSFYFDGTNTDEEVLISKTQYDKIKRMSESHMWQPTIVRVATSVDGEERSATIITKDKEQPLPKRR